MVSNAYTLIAAGAAIYLTGWRALTRARRKEREDREQERERQQFEQWSKEVRELEEEMRRKRNV